jgi:hypothetical protein
MIHDSHFWWGVLAGVVLVCAIGLGLLMKSLARWTLIP